MLAGMDGDSAKGGQERVVEDEVGAPVRCEVCSAPMKPMGHCKYWCLSCGFLRTCNDLL